MWLVQIGVASFWWYIAIHLLYREALVWSTVRQIPWFRKTFPGPSSRKWERFCRDCGTVALATGALLFITLPFGMGVFGILVATPAMLFLL